MSEGLCVCVCVCVCECEGQSESLAGSMKAESILLVWLFYSGL